MEPPTKKARLLSDDSASDSSGVEDAHGANGIGNGGESTLKINSEFAKRFQHNQARAERHRLEEKYGKGSGGSDSESDSDSDSESEDDEGELATKELDNEIFATLNAIRNKDPRVYDKQSTFYKPDAEIHSQQLQSSAKHKEKPLHLRDYHRKNLLEDAGKMPAKENGPPTYADEQAELKRNLLDQMHKLPDEDADTAEPVEEDEQEEFLVRKPGQSSESAKKDGPSIDLDVAMADKDAETYLSNFMASRAWVPTAASKYQPFESDDDEEEERADEWEAAYNMRFEDPARANENLISHSRQAAEKYSVRREEAKGRKKAREDAKSRRDAEKQQRAEEKARLRRLKIDEAQEKWLRLKEAAGLKQQHLSDETLLKFLEEGFQGENWDREMERLLGESYYAEQEDENLNADEDDADTSAHEQKPSKHKHHAKKPKWNDDIDIDDIVPGFNEDEERQRANLRLSSSDNDSDNDNDNEDPDDATTAPQAGSARSKSKSSGKKAARAAATRSARTARRKIETLIDSQLATSLDALPAQGATSSTTAPSAAPAPTFRYRDTSPTTHGLTPRDILMASDAQLNAFTGLKKLAMFRDEAKKARDRKVLGKKGRVRKWRRETFGRDDRDGDEGAESFEVFFNEARGVAAHARAQSRIGAGVPSEGNEGLGAPRAGMEGGEEEREKTKKKKRKRSKKAAAAVVEV